eukprot:Em0020g793a
MSNLYSGLETPHRWTGGDGSAGLKSGKTLIKDLVPHQPNTVIVGIVITKQSIHTFPDKRNPGAQRFNFSFTVRDSPSDYINITCWGSEMHIKKIFQTFKICDVVELRMCQVMTKQGEQDEKWKPWTPSQYHVNMSEAHSDVALYSGWDYTDYTSLAHVPLRPPNDYYTLSDILANGTTLEGSHINILAAVRDMTSKTGKPLKMCEVKLMDQSCSSFVLLIWDEELIDLAQTWTPKDNVIFAVDVKVSFDTYRNSMVATCDQKSIITTNPDCREAHQLYQFAQRIQLEEPSFLEDGSCDDVEQLTQHKQKQEVGGATFSCILFAILTSLDIDEGVNGPVAFRCTACKYHVQEGSMACSNKNCISKEFSCEPHFDLRVSLSDCTGTISGVRITGQVAMELLNKSTPQEFLEMGDSDRTELKASLQLERFKVYCKCVIPANEQRKPTVRVLSMQIADPIEVVKNLSDASATASNP